MVSKEKAVKSPFITDYRPFKEAASKMNEELDKLIAAKGSGFAEEISFTLEVTMATFPIIDKTQKILHQATKILDKKQEEDDK